MHNFTFSYTHYVAPPAAVEEMPAGYDQLMIPVIENIPLLVVVLLLTIPVAIIAMRLAEKALMKHND